MSEAVYVDSENKHPAFKNLGFCNDITVIFIYIKEHSPRELLAKTDNIESKSQLGGYVYSCFPWCGIKTDSQGSYGWELKIKTETLWFTVCVEYLDIFW